MRWGEGAARPLLTALAAGAVMLFLMPLLLPSHEDLSLLSFVSIFGLAAYSVGISFRYAGILMIAQGAVFGVGAYTAALLHGQHGFSFWAVLAPAALLAAATAVAIGAFSMRSSGHYFVILTFAINEFLVLAANHLAFTGGQSGLLILESPDRLGPFSFSDAPGRYGLYVAFLTLGIAVSGLYGATAAGRRALAVRAREDLARSVGISAWRAKILTLGIGGAMAGVAGVLYAYQQRAIEPDLFGALPVLQLVLMVVIGGYRTTLGPLIGAAIIVALPSKLGLTPLAAEIAYGVVLIVIILLVPQGIAGSLPAALRRLRSPRPAPGPAVAGKAA